MPWVQTEDGARWEHFTEEQLAEKRTYYDSFGNRHLLERVIVPIPRTSTAQHARLLISVMDDFARSCREELAGRAERPYHNHSSCFGMDGMSWHCGDSVYVAGTGFRPERPGAPEAGPFNFNF